MSNLLVNRYIVNDDDAKAACDQVPPFNAEGAVAAKGASGNTRVWIGLRAPLLAQLPGSAQQHDMAMLLRMTDLSAWKFDRVALLDLEGRGVRELARSGNTIWVIAGPANDHRTPFQLRRFSAAALDTDEVIATELVKVLPPSSEGLVISGNRAYVVIDGDWEKRAVDCITPSSLVEFDL